ncbi:ABC transporter ATP-binding protein [Pseudochrobactrum asaccharolyticum]|uniref:Iron(III) transport system ATP-binding protein/putative spermidine/putrescine transport system ATP-binding protein n=1 Tax=Pseudochrobactrum asaccharolyticum TaxID=354351 RepID=A0A366DNC4_9HYPH|nr:ABC transporter ATP-binding protein [Pseudochrobactrum asaccharolyticum]RBO90949.1 iron(III) transport system ATP-binding protein/putative spermidine/putrescine transport system ATP-binding protein [Pseudochrobactrum asaccharolyticum]
MLVFDNISRNFGTIPVLKNLSLTIKEGEVACLVGPSGCGKSTLLRLVAGLDKPDQGKIYIGNDVVSDEKTLLPVHKRNVNMVFQDFALWPHMRVSEIVGYGLKHLDQHERRERVEKLLNLLRIDTLAMRLPSELSGGQQQRVAIARALATRPKILLLDEPLSNLDVQLRMEMRLEFAELFKEFGGTVLYVTHDPLEACTFADRLIVMRKGTIEQQGTPEDLFASPSSEWVAMLAGYDIRLKGRYCISGQQLFIGDQAVEIKNRNGSPSAKQNSTAAMVMLHPASIRFRNGSFGEEGQNILSGIVTNCLYEGRQWRLTIRIDTDHFSILAPQKVTIGEVVAFSFQADDAIAFFDA